MALVYVFKITDPSNVGPLPPSATSSDWFKKFSEYNSVHRINIDGSGDGVLFDSIADYNAYVSEFKCTDADLVADIESWKAAHNIVYDHKLYDLGSGTVPGGAIL